MIQSEKRDRSHSVVSFREFLTNDISPNQENRTASSSDTEQLIKKSEDNVENQPPLSFKDRLRQLFHCNSKV